MITVAAIPQVYIIDSLPQPVFICDAASVFLHFNPAYAKLTGFRLEELVGHPALERIHDVTALPTTDGLAWFPSQVCRARHGGVSRVRLSLARWIQPDEQTPLYVGSAVPEVLSREAPGIANWNGGFHDTWTQLPNAAWFRERAALKLQSARQRLRPCALLAIEIDQMARLRDSQGDDMLGQLLQLFGHRIRGTLGPEAALATVGGGLLVCMLDGDQSEADTGIEALLRNLSMPLQGVDRSLRLTASIGAALSTHEARVDAASCCIAPAWPWVPPSRPVAGDHAGSATRCSRKPKTGCSWRACCERHSNATSSAWSISRSCTWRPGAFATWKHCCAGSALPSAK